VKRKVPIKTALFVTIFFTKNMPKFLIMADTHIVCTDTEIQGIYCASQHSSCGLLPPAKGTVTG